ncbi:MAG TPA: HNH endonuclease signature motif containing protein [Acidimicrobiales bacterium]|nr:HNH endonuclease signature motif containing protein [Acidimicrobiales bacterium]
MSPKRRRTGDIPADMRRQVKARSRGFCEACGVYGAAHVHHRKLRSQGGRHELPNLLHVHHYCHTEIHANPERSYALGLLVRGWADPADVPVTMMRGAA